MCQRAGEEPHPHRRHGPVLMLYTALGTAARREPLSAAREAVRLLRVPPRHVPVARCGIC